MKKFILFLAVLAVAGLAIRYWWQKNYPSGSWRYKMTVEVETPEGIKTGSAVREISAYSMPMLLGVSRDTYIDLVKGEAVVVDLGARGVLFLTLSGGLDAVWAFFSAFPSPCPAGSFSRCSIRYYSSLRSTGQSSLPVRAYPMFVTFKDLNDPTSVVRVLEMKSCPDPETGIPDNSLCIEKDRFEEVFGQGVRLKSVSIEVTEEDVMWEIQRILPWLGNYYDKRLDGQRFGSANALYMLANGLSSGAFSVGGRNGH